MEETKVSGVILSDTPKTDALVNQLLELHLPSDYATQIADLARQLERENADLRHDIERAIANDSSHLAENAALREALDRILWVKDCGIDGRDESGVFRNWPETERDMMYEIASASLKGLSNKY